MSMEITGLDRVLKKLGKLSTFDVFEPPMQRSVLKIHHAIAEAPPPPRPGEWASKTTQAQKRAFFAKVRSGKYRGRTGTLGRRWTTAVVKTADGLEGRIGNNTEYGPWVQSKRFQARFHKVRWKTDDDVLRELRDDIIDDFRDTARKAAQD